MVDEAAVIVTTMQAPPPASGLTPWSSRELATRINVSHHEVASIWRTGGLQPPRVESLTFSPDPELEAKITDVVGLYLDPPQHAVVLCVDDKPQVQALEKTQPVLPAVPGVPERRWHDDDRHGVSSLFAALEIATGKGGG